MAMPWSQPTHGVCDSALDHYQQSVEEEFKKCIECGACYISCPFDLWGSNDEERQQAIRDANDFIFNRKPITEFLKSEIFSCAECDHCHQTCPAGIHRKHANMLIKLRIQPRHVDRLRAHPARLRGTKQYFFEKLTTRKWSPPEQAWYAALNEKRQSDTLLYHGCYVASTKNDCMKLGEMLAHAGIDHVAFGKFEYCCGQFGLYRGVSDLCETSPKLIEMVEATQPKEIITNCGHCREAVESVLKMMNNTTIRVLHPAEKLLELVQQQKLRMKFLDQSVTIQDSCLFSQKQPDSPVRNLLARAVDLYENKDSLQNALCCGDVSHVAAPEKIHHYNQSRVRTFNEMDADHLAVYCAGCNDIYSAFDELKTRDLIDIVYQSWQEELKETI
jgi:Fe-S oxidoreductase